MYHFDPGAFVLNRGDNVIVETEQGLGFGTVVAPPATRDDLPEDRPVKKIFRMANDKDRSQMEKNGKLEQIAQDFCQKCINELGLKMNLFSVESIFDGSKLTFFFTAEGRVDFRQLVKMLVKEFRIRIEMRQVGIRNQAKMCGGIGRCGRRICCSTMIDKFEPVSIRMAKEQNLSLNPTKISGLCGRLMCCLTFEYDTYMGLKKNMPKIGKTVRTKQGDGKVIRHNVINKKVVVRLEDGAEIETDLDGVSQKPSERKTGRKNPPSRKGRPKK